VNTVAHAIGTALAQTGVTTVFGVAGSGNFHLTNALTAVRAGTAARHEGGAAVMADAYARVSGGLGVLSVHRGPGLTNAMTGITEAAKSRTPMLILAAEATAPRSKRWPPRGGRCSSREGAPATRGKISFICPNGRERLLPPQPSPARAG